MDQTTCWGSTYLMVKHLLDLKDFIFKDISTWMSRHFLKLNLSKTELIVFPPPRVPSPVLSITVNGSKIDSSHQARVLGVILDSELSFQPYIHLLSKSCRLHLRNISKIRPFLTNDTAKLLIHSLVISRLDYCNSLLVGLPLNRLSPLQSIMNAAARLIHLSDRSSSASPLCQSLHWLPLAQRIKFKILTITYKAIHNSAPTYLTQLISKYHPNRPLRSSQDLLLSCSLVTSSHKRIQDFSRTSPILWNSLPKTIRLSPTLSAFRRSLKTHLFREAYSTSS